MQTDDTVRAFSGTLRRISGGVCVSCFDSDPLTATGAAVEAILVDVRALVLNAASEMKREMLATMIRANK